MRRIVVGERHSGVSVLKVNMAGTPLDWLSPKDAISYVAQGDVAWSFGQDAVVFHGGIQRVTGKQSILSAPAIIAVRGTEKAKSYESGDDVLPLKRNCLFRRDRCLCAYCGNVYPEAVLTIEHVIPKSKKGANVWSNVVTACKACNQKKDDRTPEEAHMPLLYLPYVPNRFEHFILDKKSQYILGDQMEYLLAKVGSNSRLAS